MHDLKENYLCRCKKCKRRFNSKPGGSCKSGGKHSLHYNKKSRFVCTKCEQKWGVKPHSPCPDACVLWNCWPSVVHKNKVLWNSELLKMVKISPKQRTKPNAVMPRQKPYARNIGLYSAEKLEVLNSRVFKNLALSERLHILKSYILSFDHYQECYSDNDFKKYDDCTLIFWHIQTSTLKSMIQTGAVYHIGKRSGHVVTYTSKEDLDSDLTIIKVAKRLQEASGHA
jgi:hypothetical protein